MVLAARHGQSPWERLHGRKEISAFSAPPSCSYFGLSSSPPDLPKMQIRLPHLPDPTGNVLGHRDLPAQPVGVGTASVCSGGSSCGQISGSNASHCEWGWLMPPWGPLPDKSPLGPDQECNLWAGDCLSHPWSPETSCDAFAAPQDSWGKWNLQVKGKLSLARAVPDEDLSSGSCSVPLIFADLPVCVSVWSPGTIHFPDG